MNPFKNLRIAVLCLIAVVIAAFIGSYVARGGGPSDSFIKDMVKKQMTARFKECTITSINLLRGDEFQLQAHQSKVAFGTVIHPVVVRATYTAKLPDGTQSESKEFNRTLNFYKDASHQWVNDNELH
jgi:hypothetical protein